jgi:hypothetical protein
MIRRRSGLPLALVSVLALSLSGAAGKARAQNLGRHLTVEAVASASTTTDAPGDPMLIFDGVATVRLGRDLDVIARPYAHRLPGNRWTAEMYQLQLRYVTPMRPRIRIDAGILAAPMGLATLEMIPDRNPTISGPFFFFAPLPAFSSPREEALVLAPGYPLGVMASASGDRWDARAGVIDQTPARRRNVLASDRPAAAAQVVAGGGVTPMPGFRIGAGFAHGRYGQVQDLDATVINVEAEYAAGYTRVAGEWIRDRFETPTGPAIVNALTAQAVRTITPRWFAAARASRASSPVLRAGSRQQMAASAIEATAGYRLSPELTLKASHQASRRYGVADWDHTMAASVVVSRRWW